MAEDFLKGSWHALASLFGASKQTDPLADLNSELTTANQNLIDSINLGTVLALQAQQSWDKDLLSYLKNNFRKIQENINFYNTISSNNQAQDNYFFVVGGILIFMIIIFILFK